AYLEQALRDLGMEGSFPILKFGVSYPLDAEMVKEFAQGVEEIVVIEEKRPFLEEQVVRILNLAYQAGEFEHPVPVWGKIFPEGLKGIPETKGLNSSVLIEHLVPLL